MADEGHLYRELDGLYGKLDRLLEKRAPDVLADRTAMDRDFPLLTEVVADDIPVRHRVARSVPPAPDETPARPVSAPTPAAPEPEVPAELMAAIEARLFELLARHQQELDATVRRIVREELARWGRR